MSRSALRIGIIGDFNPDAHPHRATDAALQHAAAALSCTVETTWLPTEELESTEQNQTLRSCDGLWAASRPTSAITV